jgi:membrane protease YdiL (CAAX protease family)
VIKSGAMVALGVLFALVFPSVVTWIYFVVMAEASKGAQGLTYSSLKVVQFLFPVVWVVWVLKGQTRQQGRSEIGVGDAESTGGASGTLRSVVGSIFSVGGSDAVNMPRPSLAAQGRATQAQGRATLSLINAVVAGIVFGLAVTVGGWLVYRGWLGESAMFMAAAEKIRAKVAGFGVDSVAAYAAMGLFYSVVHSFLEEYYWRWFVFGQLRRLVPLWVAIVVSSLGFMAHHVIVLGSYFGGLSTMTVLFSAAVAIGGAFWAWLYERSGSLVGSWVSHLIVDAGIFLLGFALVRGAL